MSSKTLRQLSGTLCEAQAESTPAAGTTSELRKARRVDECNCVTSVDTRCVTQTKSNHRALLPEVPNIVFQVASLLLVSVQGNFRASPKVLLAVLVDASRRHRRRHHHHNKTSVSDIQSRGVTPRSSGDQLTCESYQTVAASELGELGDQRTSNRNVTWGASSVVLSDHCQGWPSSPPPPS